MRCSPARPSRSSRTSRGRSRGLSPDPCADRYAVGDTRSALRPWPDPRSGGTPGARRARDDAIDHTRRRRTTCAPTCSASKRSFVAPWTGRSTLLPVLARVPSPRSVGAGSTRDDPLPRRTVTPCSAPAPAERLADLGFPGWTRPAGQTGPGLPPRGVAGSPDAQALRPRARGVLGDAAGPGRAHVAEPVDADARRPHLLVGDDPAVRPPVRHERVPDVRWSPVGRGGR